MTDVVTTTKDSHTVTLNNGKTSQPLNAGRPNTVKAKAGENYRILQKAKTGEEQLLDNVIAKESGDDLVLNYADGTQLTLENFYGECKAGGCDVTLAGQDAGGYSLAGASPAGAALGDGSTLAYAHGTPDALMAMTQGNDAMRSALTGPVGEQITYLPSHAFPLTNYAIPLLAVLGSDKASTHVTLAPPKPGTLSLANFSDSGASASDGITQDGTFNLSVTGSETGASLSYEVSTDGGVSWAATTATQTSLADGSYSFRATATDASGNRVTGNVISVKVDNAAPTSGTLSFTGLSDSGSSASDGITQDGTFNLSVTGSETGASLSYEVSTNGGVSWAATTATQTSLADGSYSFRATATDASGNRVTGNVISVKVDNAAPTSGTLSFTGLSDSGASASDGITQDGTFNLSVTGSETGASLSYEVSTNGGVSWAATTATQTSLADGSYSFRATATDASGNHVTGNVISVRVDNAPPNAISVALSPTDDGDSSNGVDLRVTLAADAKAGDTATTEILRGGVVVQTILSVLTATDISSGNLSVYVAAASVAVDGSYSVRTQLADPAGNRGNTVSNTAAFTVFTGLVHDDYLANAFVFVDSNHNNKWDAGEVTTRTDASGNFKFAFDPQGAPVLAMGGVDTASGAANSGVVYKAYTGSIDAAAAGVDVVLSPLSSLIAGVAVQTAGQGQAIDSAALVAAAQVVVTVLSLNISDPGSLLNFDPVAASAATGASASERGLLSANRQLGLLLSATAAMIDGAKVANAPTATGAGSEMGIGALAGMVLARAEAETVWNPSNTADIEIMLQSAMDASNASGITQDLRASSAADLTLLSSVIGGFNARVDATTQAGTQSLDAVAAMRAASDQLLPMLRKSGNEAASDRGGDISLSASLAALATGVAGDVASYVQAQTDAVSQITAMFETNAADGKVGRLVQLDIQLPSVGLGDTVDSLVLSGLPDGVTLLRVDPLTGVAAALQPAEGGVYAVAPQDVGYLAIRATSVVSGSITLAATNLVGGISTPFSGMLAINIGALPVISQATMGTVTDNAGLVTGALTKGARTDDATPTLSGSLSSALSGSDTVAIYDGAAFLGNATVTGQAWSFTPDATPGAALAEGAHAFTARVMSGGQVQSASSLFSLSVDTQAPDAPLLFPSDGSAVVGTAEPGVLVQVRSGGTLIGTATADANGAWSITALSTLAGGAALSAIATDASGLISQPGTGTVSLGAPTQVPTLLSVTDDVAKFKGALQQGASTNDTTPTLQGKLSAALGTDVSLHVFDGDVDLGLATVSGTNWSFTPTEALGQGEHNFTVQVARGSRIGAASPAFSLNVDTQAPDAPVMDDVAGDGQINAREQGSVITGSAEPGATVALTLGAGNVRSAVADAQGVWRYTMVASDTTAMGQGSEPLTATATDAAGNTSDLVSQSITVDTLAPVFSSGPAGAVAENAGTGTAIYTAATTDGSNQVAPTYTLSGTDAALLGISSAGVVTLKASANFETKASYSFTLVATDSAGNASEKAVTLAINNLDEVAPSITSGSSATAINENTSAGQVVYTATSTDTADIASDSTTYSLKTGSDAGLTISASTGAVTLTGSADFETKASYSFTVVATDAAGNAREKPVTLAATNLDEAAPTITSGDTATAITENGSAGQVVYTATSTDTGDTDTATGSTSYSLKAGSDASAFSINATSGAVTLTASPDFETKPSYAFTVVATDAAGNAREKPVTLAISNRDEVAPTITSGATATVIDENTSEGQVVYTAASTDSGDIATGSTTYSLKANNSDDAASFSIDASTGAVTLTASPDFETKPSYAFTVVATDAAGNAREKPVTLAINDIEPEGPRVTSGASASAINENTSAGQVIYTATSNAVTGAAVYSLKTGSDAGLTIDPSTGAVTLTGSPDFETKASYSFTVVATGTDSLAAEKAVTLAITNLDEVAPSITSSATAAAINENTSAGQVVYTATSTDSADIASGSTTYSLKTGSDAGLTISASTGAVTLTGAPNYETKSSYAFTVVATDAAGNVREKPVTLAINNLDEAAPTITSGATATAINENTSAGQVVYTATSTDTADAATGNTSYSLKTGSDAGLTIDSETGAVTLTGAPNYEAKPSYAFTVVATDAAGNVAEQAVTLAITNRDEVAPAFTSGATATAIDENTSAGQVVYTAASTDSGDIATGSTTYSLKANNSDDAASFSIDASTGAVTLTASPDFETKPSYAFTVVATDAAGNAREKPVTLAINDIEPEGPRVTSGASASAINENTSAGQVVYTATSNGVTGTAVYSLKTGSDAGLTIDASTGAVTLTGSPDFETKASYSFTVVATGTDSLAAEKAVTLAITNLDEVAPSITSSATAAAINENTSAGQVVYTATSTDSADIASGSTTYSLKTGSDAGLTIDPSTGEVTLTGAPNHETKASYAFTVVATDAAGNVREKPVTLAISNLDEAAPTITSGATATAINENTSAGQVVYTATSTDTADAATGATAYSLKAATGDVSAFSIDATSGAVTLTGAPNYEAKPSYAFTVVATDAAGNVAEQAVTLAVTNRDEVAPTITSGATATAIDENTSEGQVVYTAASTDSGDIATGSTTYSLKANNSDDAASFSIDASTGAVTLTASPDFETKPSYAFTVVATDAARNTSEKAVALAINNIEPEGPRVTSGASASAINENTSAGQVVYTATSNGVAGTAVYSLKGGSDAGLSINASTGEVTLAGAPNYETKASYAFTVVATGTDNVAAEKAVTLAINNLDEVAPSITSSATAAAINENTSAGQVVYTVTSTDTADIASGSTTYSLKTGSDAGLTIDPSTGEVTLTGAPNHETKASYAFTVVATDAAGNVREKPVTLAINNLDEAAPTITSGATATAINENTSAGQVVYTATSTDTADAATGATAYSLKAATGDVSAFSIDATSGAVTLTGAPNYEAKPSYAFTVVATDAAGNVAEQAVTLAVTNRDEVAPTITSGATATAIDENTSAGQLIYTATSTDTGDTATGATVYSLKAATGDVSAFSIDATSGAVTLTASPDYETKPSYAFTVVATDAAGNAREQAVTLAINDIEPEGPRVTSGASASAINENTSAGQVVYTATSNGVTGTAVYSLKTGSDAGLTINANTGAVTLTGSPDFETKASYSFTVVATGTDSLAAEKAVTLAITNLDEVAPSITSSATAAAINENTSAGQVVYTATSTDSADIASGSTTYSLKANNSDDASAFSISTSTGAVTLTGAPNYETKASYAFTVVATDAAGHASEKAVTLAINNLDEVAPTITSGASTTAIAENTSAGQVVYTATSTDTADAATGSTNYSLKAATGDVSAFSINATSGAVTLTGAPNYETKPSYAFTVVATDAAGNVAEQAVTLAITNRDEVAPTITSGATATAIDENTSAGQVIYTATSTDTADAATGSTAYSLKTGSDAGLTIDATSGEVTLTGSPDFETKASYAFTVVATDAAGNAREKPVTLAINDIEPEGPRVTSSASASAVNENTSAGQVIYTATSNGVTGTAVYSLKTGSDAGLTIDSGTGAVTLTGSPDFETQASYSFTVVATGTDSLAAEKAVTLAITNLDEVAPSITSSATATAINENTSAGQVVYTATSTDSADIATGATAYSLKANTGDASAFSISASTGAVTLTGAPNYETKASYAFTVVATDAAGNVREKPVTLAINNLDEAAPTITSGATATAINENTSAGQVVYTATSTDTTDAATGATAYSLKTGSDAGLTISASTGAVTLTGAPNYETKASYAFTVVATDAAGNVREKPVTLAINNLDEAAPTITSGATATAINENASAGQVVYTATSTDTTDAATGATAYSLKAGSDAGLTIDATSGEVTLTGSPDFETKASYAFTVVATDAAGNVAEQAVTLAINDIEPEGPRVTSGASASAINENTSAGQVVYTATSNGVAGTAVYSLKGGSDAGLSINASTGEVTLAGAPNYETKASYAFTVVATGTDNVAAEKAVTLAINNLDEVAPSITSGATATAINENVSAGQVVYTAIATDSGDIATGSTSYSLKSGSDAGLTINPTSGAVTLTGVPNFETKPSYAFTVVATDAAGHASEQGVTLAINNLDEVAPTITGGATATATPLNEGSGAGQVVYTAASTDTTDYVAGSTSYSLKTGSDAGLTISASTGAVTLTGNPSYATKSSYAFTVVATDAANNPSEQAVSLAINEVVPGITSGATAAVNENIGSSKTVYTVTSAGITGTAVYSLKTGVGAGDGSSFGINSSTGVVTLTNNPNYESKTSYSFTVKATAGSTVFEKAVTLVINNLDDTAPSFSSASTANAINENSGAGRLVYTAISTDTDYVSGSTTYSLKANSDDAAAFSIDGTTGAVTLTGNPNYETKSSYRFTVIATDAAGNATGDMMSPKPSKTVTLNITNVDDTAPSFTSQATASANENSGTNQVVYTAAASNTVDMPTGNVSYSLKAATGDVADFSINTSTGAVTLTGSPDFETKSSYSFTVVATDVVGNFSEKAVTLSITNKDEASPTFTSGDTATAIAENSGARQVVYTAASTDTVDLVSGRYTRYSIKANTGDASAFSINESTGAVTLTGNPDYEAKASYSFTVVATDNSGNATEKAVTLQVIDAVELTSIVENSNTGLNQLVYTATGGASYSLKPGSDTGLAIDAATGAVTMSANPDYEVKRSYNFTVLVTDGGGTTTEQVLTFSITDLDDTAPSFSSPTATAAAIDENSGAGQVIFTAITSDPDSLSTAYSLKSGSDAGLTIDATSGAVTLTGNPDFETKASYSFTVVATDPANNFSEQAVTLAINNLDETPPVMTQGATATATITEGESLGLQVYTAAATDLNDAGVDVTPNLRYSLKDGSDQDLQIDWQTGEVTLNVSPDFETKTSYSFTVVATDQSLNAVEQVVTLTVTNLDEVAPTFTSEQSATAIDENSGAGQVVYTALSTDTVDYVTGSTSYSLKADNNDDAAAFSIDASTGAVTLTGNPNYEAKSVYDFEVVATDEAGNYSQQSVTLLINDIEELFIDERSGANQVIHNAPGASLAVSVDSTHFSYNAETGDVTLIDNPEFATQARYEFVLMTDIGDGIFTENRLQVEVIDSVKLTVNENIVQSQEVYTFTPVIGIDYRLKVWSALFNFSPAGSVSLGFIPDYENPEQAHHYSFTVVATDVYQLVTLAINNLDEVAPTITSSTNTLFVSEQSGADQVIYTATSTDTVDYVSGNTVYSLKSTDDASAFSIDASTGKVTLIANPDFGTQASYAFTVVATDAADNFSEQSLQLQVNRVLALTPINENSGELQLVASAASLFESPSAGTLYSLKAATGDVSAFSIDYSTGEVTLTADPDYETKPSYSFTVVATDDKGVALEQPVRLAINNLDEVAPSITSDSSATAITENSGAGQVVYTATSIDTGDIATGNTVYSLKTGSDADLTINASTGAVTLTGSPDFETQASYSFTVVATDAANYSSEKAVTLAINNVDEAGPVFSDQSSRSINEKTGAGQVIYTANTYDPDYVSGDTTYTLLEALASAGGYYNYFRINASTGAVTLRDNPNYDVRSNYYFQVTATDAAGYFSSQDFRLYIVDKNQSMTWDTDFYESRANDGTVNTVIKLQLTNEIFTGSNGDELSDTTFTNIPAGLTPLLIRTSDTTAELRLIGSAVAHASQDSLQIGVSLGDGDFTQTLASQITGSSINLGVTFASPGTQVSNFQYWRTAVGVNRAGVDQIGTPGDDSLIGTTGIETVIAGTGNDTLTGSGYSDALFGGAGNDTFVLNADFNFSRIYYLDKEKFIQSINGSPTPEILLARVDGGSGFDTIKFNGADFNPGVMASAMSSIERIDMTGGGDQTLTFGIYDMLTYQDTNSFNNFNGWADGTYNLASGGANGDNPEQRHQLVIDGDAGDAVSSSGWGTSVGTVTHAGVTYNVYNQGLYAQLLIDTAVTQTVL